MKLFIAFISDDRLFFSTSHLLEYNLFAWPSPEDRTVIDCYETVRDGIQKLSDRFKEIDYVFFLGASIQGIIIEAMWFAIDHDDDNNVDRIDPSDLPKTFNFGGPDVYWDA